MKRIENIILLLVFIGFGTHVFGADAKVPPTNDATKPAAQAAGKPDAKPVSIKEKFVIESEADGYITVIAFDGGDSKVMTFRWPDSGLKRGNVVNVTATKVAKDAKPAEPKKGDLTETFNVEMAMEGQIAAASFRDKQVRVMTFQWPGDDIKQGDALSVTMQTVKEADGTAKVVDLDQLQSDTEDAELQADIDEAIAEENAQRKLAKQPKMSPVEELQRRNLLRLVSVKISQEIKDAIDGKKPDAK